MRSPLASEFSMRRWTVLCVLGSSLNDLITSSLTADMTTSAAPKGRTNVEVFPASMEFSFPSSSKKTCR